jgi:hypothetical protein
MKHLYTLFFFCIALAANAQIQINTPEPYYYCDQDGNGTETVDLGSYNAYILDSNNPTEYSVKYFLTEEFAQQNMLQLPYIYTFSTSATPQQIFVRVTENANTDNFALTSLNIIRSVIPVIPALPPIQPLNCAGIYNLTYNNYVYDLMTINTIDFYISQNDAITGQNPINQPNNYMANQGSVWVRIANSNVGCYAIAEQHLANVPFLMATISINGQTATIDATGMGPFTYSIISAPIGFTHALPYQTSNVITDLPLGRYTIQIEDVCGNIRVVTFSIIDIDAPTGETNQTFTQGETLADLEVSGGGGPIEWYDAPTGGNLLPITTLLVDDTTYYAERSSGTFRANRLAVTVNLVLSNSSNTLQTLTYFPNPVNNILTLKNASAINSISVNNAIGQQVLSKGVNATNAVVDLSALNAGIYFVKVQAGENDKTIRIIKE